MRKWYTDKYGSDWLDKLDAAVEECTGKVDEEFFAAKEMANFLKSSRNGGEPAPFHCSVAISPVSYIRLE